MKQRQKKIRPTMPYQLSIRFTEAQYELLTEDAKKHIFQEPNISVS